MADVNAPDVPPESDRVAVLEGEVARLRCELKLYMPVAFTASSEAAAATDRLREFKLAAKKGREEGSFGLSAERMGLERKVRQLELDAEEHEFVAEGLRRGKKAADLRVEGLEGAMAMLESKKRSAEAEVAAKLAEIKALEAQVGVLSSKSEQPEAEIGELKELGEIKIKCSEIRKSKSEQEVRVDELKGRAGSATPARFSRLGSMVAAASSAGSCSKN